MLTSEAGFGSRAVVHLDLDHLSAAKRQELARIVSVLFDEFATSLAGRNAPHRRNGRILKVILFGSYARGDFVSDPDGGYFSDFDLLVVVNDEELADGEYWRGAEDHLLRDLEAGALSTQVNLIVHSLADVNAKLKRGRPFFVDIVRDGIALHDTADHPFDPPKSLSAEAARIEASRLFDEWFPGSVNFQILAGQAVAGNMPKEAAFLLHQATERLYHCTLLVLTLYSPKSHKLAFLRAQGERIAPALVEAWPRDTRFARRSFELLRRAYVDARYSPHYHITEEELGWIAERVQILGRLVEQVCATHLGRDALSC